VTHETRARMTLARAISADFTREAREARRPDWPTWAHRLNTALAGLLAALDASTAPLLDGGAYVSGPDLRTILAALRDGAEYRCNNPGDSDLATIAAFRMLSFALGDDR
jgi:hypothetical protein